MGYGTTSGAEAFTDPHRFSACYETQKELYFKTLCACTADRESASAKRLLLPSASGMGERRRLVRSLSFVSAMSWSSLDAWITVLSRVRRPTRRSVAHSSSRDLREEICRKPTVRFGPGQDGIRVEDIWVNPRSREDIPKLLGCLREQYLDVDLREEVFRLLRTGSGVPARDVRRSFRCGPFWCLGC